MGRSAKLVQGGLLAGQRVEVDLSVLDPEERGVGLVCVRMVLNFAPRLLVSATLAV